MVATDQLPRLSIVVTIVSGPASLKQCLDSLCLQAERARAEVIVPYDKYSEEAVALIREFPAVRFVKVHYPENGRRVPRQHEMYDRRRAVGLRKARAPIIAMTEDHAIPADDWCSEVLAAHSEQPDAVVIGGAIENAVDRPLNWVRYYCDFGRYGRPLTGQPAEYISDVNVSYKRSALLAMRSIWKDFYRETTVHWEMMRRGADLRLSERIVVFQHRAQTTVRSAINERIAWGRAFAETRVAEIGVRDRALLAAGTIVLPLILYRRIVGHMRRQKRPLAFIMRMTPAILLLVAAWSAGEALGYVAGPGFDDPAAGLERLETRTTADL